MPPKRTSKDCSHAQLQLEPSAYAVEAGFERKSAAERIAAATKSGRKLRSGPEDPSADERLSTFPGPLVLPWDDLGWEPEIDLQSFRSWHQEKVRNKPTQARKTLYVLEAPEITKDVKFMEPWIQPQLQADGRAASSGRDSDAKPYLAAQEMVDYLAAFYNGFPTKLFPHRLRFVPWEEKSKAKGSKKGIQQQYVGLATVDGNATRIRARRSPDGVFNGQLNLEDILDAAIEMLPKDAYSVVLLMDHDLYEDEEDDFCCGRAYGGSRVSVVSTARYRPELDDETKLDRMHMWPASHCRDYVAKLCAEQDIHNKTRKVSTASSSPMQVAVEAASRTKHSDEQSYLKGLWFSRVARTVSHELGHCLCLAHCGYYACLMQSTSGMAEDVRQPPYLCDVCLSKISYKVTVELQRSSEEARADYAVERYAALESFCDRWKHVGMFAGYQAWLKARLGQLTSEQ